MSAIRWHESELRRLLEGRDGAVARDLAQRAVRVESAAKERASGRPGPNVDTGRLRSSIAWELRHDALGLYAVVGSDVEYARYVEALYPYLEPALEAAR
jgi:hypothetical protein